jgi:hypothetical protein
MVEDLHLRSFLSIKVLAMNQFGLQGSKERLHRSIVSAVSFAIRTARHLIVLQHVLTIIGCILAAMKWQLRIGKDLLKENGA